MCSSSGRISIHALREEGDEVANSVGLRGAISIHALREEGDPRIPAERSAGVNFYPRPPRGGRPEEGTKNDGAAEISIHALREEGDNHTSM